MTLCAPFTLTYHNGKAWITRDGVRQRVAYPELVHLWERRPEALVALCELADGLVVWAIEGQGWQNDAALLREAAKALEARAGAIEART